MQHRNLLFPMNMTMKAFIVFVCSISYAIIRYIVLETYHLPICRHTSSIKPLRFRRRFASSLPRRITSKRIMSSSGSGVFYPFPVLSSTFFFLFPFLQKATIQDFSDRTS